MSVGMVIALQRHMQVLTEAATPLLTRPARELKRAEAWTLLEYHGLKGDIKLLRDRRSNKDERAVLSTSMAGVQYLHASGNNARSRLGSVGASVTPEFSPTAEFAVVLYRLALWLKTRWDATHIVWGGIGAGSGKNASDCHSGGHCVDFYAAHTRLGGVIDVGRDWYYRPVYTANGKTHERVGSDWWGNDTKTTYRLLVTRDAEARDPADKDYWNFRARDFFLDVLEFAGAECNSTGDSAVSELRAGAVLKTGVTFHPDYPQYNNPGRRAHWDHIHFQLGDAIHRK